MTTEITDTEKLTVLKLLAGGRDAAFAATAVGKDVDTVTRVASHHGYPDTAKLSWAADILQKNIDDTRRAAAANGTARPSPARPGPNPAAPPSRVSPVADTTANLIARGKKSEKARTKRLAEKAETALADLTAALRTEQEARRAAAAKAAEREQQRAAAAAERAQRKARIEALEREIRELRAAERANGSTTATRTPAVLTQRTGVDPKVVRAWAAAAGVECATHGRVPQAVVEQYLAAHPAVG